jgi:hypothetical protein
MPSAIDDKQKITIEIENLATDHVFLATSPELPGLIVESDTENDIYELSRALAQLLMSDMNLNVQNVEIEYKTKRLH